MCGGKVGRRVTAVDLIARQKEKKGRLGGGATSVDWTRIYKGLLELT
jgi:hypothetical protein